MSLRPVIIAGGQGSRFWPASRASLPKQFLTIGDNSLSLIQSAAARVSSFVNEQDVIVVTGKRYESLCKDHLPNAQLVAEPFPKNTAIAVGLGAVKLAKQDPDAVMLVLWADSAIGNDEEFNRVINLAYNYIKDSDQVGIVGIVPEYPHTGYGYIEVDSKISEGIFSFRKFMEKPNLETAKTFVNSGKYYWNPGIFIWKVETILNEFKKNCPDMYEGLMEIKDALDTKNQDKVINDVFSRVESISIDYAIMEKITKGVVFPAKNMQWSDVGSWDVWAEYHSKDENNNVFLGDVIAIDSKKNIVNSKDKLIALIGIEDIVVVDTKDALLVCKKDQVQRIKEVVEKLKNSGRDELV